MAHLDFDFVIIPTSKSAIGLSDSVNILHNFILDKVAILPVDLNLLVQTNIVILVAKYISITTTRGIAIASSLFSIFFAFTLYSYS